MTGKMKNKINPNNTRMKLMKRLVMNASNRCSLLSFISPNNVETG